MHDPNPRPDTIADMLAPMGDAAPAGHPARVARQRPNTLRHLRRSASLPQFIRRYQRWRAASSIALVALFFLGIWLLNGYFTVQAARGLGWSVAIGCAIHLGLSLIELTTVVAAPHLRAVRAPGWVHLVIWIMVVPIGVLDTLTSAIGLVQWGLALSLPLGLPLQGSATLAALGLAFLPEPMLIWLMAALGSALHHR